MSVCVEDDVGAFLQLFLLSSLVVTRRRRRRRPPALTLRLFVSARSRSLLSTVTGDDKMMESMSNAVAILFVTGGAFREPKEGPLLLDISTSLNSRATLLLSLPLPFNPLYISQL